MKVIQNRRNVTPIIIKSTWNIQINSILDLSSQLIECFASSKFLYQANTRKKKQNKTPHHSSKQQQKQMHSLEHKRNQEN